MESTPPPTGGQPFPGPFPGSPPPGATPEATPGAAFSPFPAPGERKSSLAFFLALLALLLLGLVAQAASPAVGLLWTELFAFLLPAAAAAAGSNLRPAAFLRLSPRPPARTVALGALAGAAGYVLAGALMSAAQEALPPDWVKAFDLSPLFHGPAWERIAVTAAAAVLAPVCEEAAFRGYVLSALGLAWRPRAAIAASALLFAVMHLDPVRFPALLALGVLFGWLAWRAGSLWPAVAAHAANNGIAALLALQGLPDGPPERLPPSAIALAIAIGAVLLAPALAAYRAATPSPPALRAAAVLRDPRRASIRFSLAALPPPYLLGELGGIFALGLLLLAAAARAHP